MARRIALGGNARHRRLPGLLKRADAVAWAAGMGHDAAAGGEYEVGRSERGQGPGRLLGGLARREDRHRQAGLVGEERRQTGARRLYDALVGFAELVGESVDVHVIRAGEPPELL